MVRETRTMACNGSWDTNQGGMVRETRTMAMAWQTESKANRI